MTCQGFSPHETVGALAHFLRLTANLSCRVRDGALGGGPTGHFHFRAHSGDVRRLHVLEGAGQVFDVVEEIVDLAEGKLFDIVGGGSNLLRIPGKLLAGHEWIRPPPGRRPWGRLPRGRLDPAAHAHQESDDCADQEDDEQYFRDAGGADGDAAKAENGGNQRDDKEDNGIMKHGRTIYWDCNCGRRHCPRRMA